MHVGALQSNVEAMLHRLEVLMARFPWTQMVLFSEFAPYGPLPRFAQPFMNEALDRFCVAVRQYGVWLIPGSMFEIGEEEKIYNTSAVINPQGEIVTKCRKMFPFRPYEAEMVAGTEFCLFDVPGVGRFGLSICYGIWFPETTRQLKAKGHGASPKTALEILATVQRFIAYIGEKPFTGTTRTKPEQLSLFEALDVSKPA